MELATLFIAKEQNKIANGDSMAALQNIERVQVSRISLYLGNPRHEPLKDQTETIAALCAKEDILPIAKDIANLGLNPLENFAIFPTGGKPKPGGAQHYISAEGNRRLCALKLLNDPDLAPPKIRKAIEKLSASWTQIRTVSAVIFKDFHETRVWLERTHNGAYGGIGRKQWNADQKTRFDGKNKNSLALEVLDYAELEGMISADERRKKITTVQRFTSNPLFRDAMGIQTDGPENAVRNRAKSGFDGLMKKFITDLVTGTLVNSRMNKREIEDYARQLAASPDAAGPRVQAEPFRTTINSKKPKPIRKKPKIPEKVRTVRHEQEIYDALKKLGNDKLSSLYYSICSVELERHTPLVAIGVWAFFETLTSCAGRFDGTNFMGYLSKAKIVGYGISASDAKSLQDVLNRIQNYGNSTKHHPLSATFNGDQLNNDMVASKGLILKCIEEAQSKP